MISLSKLASARRVSTQQQLAQIIAAHYLDSEDKKIWGYTELFSKDKY